MRVRRTLSPLVAITQNNDESFAIEEGLNLLNISSMMLLSLHQIGLEQVDLKLEM